MTMNASFAFAPSETRSAGDGLGTAHAALPLNLVAMIIGYLSDPGDLARACRTCRIFHYMCLPNLYSHVTLRSYDHVRYNPDTSWPEGCGGGSPFTMGLNALITRDVARYTKSFELSGIYHEPGSEDQARVGRVPDGGMMLSLLVRTALDRMSNLQSFIWNLNIKMLPVVWQALIDKTSLTSLSVSFPSSRLPSPIYTPPGIPHLRTLAFRNVDPLCYPDNLTQILCDSVNLEHLKLHWSPRMRQARESSVNLQMYFGKILLSSRKLCLRSLALQNLYSLEHRGNILGVYDPARLESMTSIDSAGGADDNSGTAFVSEPPKHLAPMPRLRFVRGNKVSRRHREGLARMRGLQKYFLITGRDPSAPDRRDFHAESRQDPSQAPSHHRYASSAGSSVVGTAEGNWHEAGTPRSASGADMGTVIAVTPSAGGLGNGFTGGPGVGSGSISASQHFISQPSATPTSSSSDRPIAALGPDYLETIARVHGQTLTHLLLLPQWRLGSDAATTLARACPHLIELGLGLVASTLPSTLPILLDGAALPNLRALRVLDAPPETPLSALASVQSDAGHGASFGGSYSPSIQRFAEPGLGLGSRSPTTHRPNDPGLQSGPGARSPSTHHRANEIGARSPSGIRPTEHSSRFRAMHHGPQPRSDDEFGGSGRDGSENASVVQRDGTSSIEDGDGDGDGESTVEGVASSAARKLAGAGFEAFLGTAVARSRVRWVGLGELLFEVRGLSEQAAAASAPGEANSNSTSNPNPVLNAVSNSNTNSSSSSSSGMGSNGGARTGGFSQGSGSNGLAEGALRRDVIRRPWGAVRDVEIWKMDRLEI